MVTEDREDGRGGGLLVLGAGDAVAQRGGGKDSLHRFWVGDVDQIRSVLEERCNEQVAVVRVEFSGVDWGFEFDCAYAFLSLKVP